jgi:hypothetical protein
MKRLFCLMLLLLPLAGCAFFEDCVAFSEREWHKFAEDDSACRPVRACSDSVNLPTPTAEPPR